ncbi:MAG: Uracil-DNA glycosylase, putative family 6, partial [uncultured Quadrisphaera sp.]
GREHRAPRGAGVGAAGRRGRRAARGGAGVPRVRAVGAGDPGGVLRRQPERARGPGRRAAGRPGGPARHPLRRARGAAAAAGDGGGGPGPRGRLRDQRGQALPVRPARQAADPRHPGGRPRHRVQAVAGRRARRGGAAGGGLPGRDGGALPARHAGEGDARPGHPDGPRDLHRHHHLPRHRPPLLGAARAGRRPGRRVRGAGRRPRRRRRPGGRSRAGGRRPGPAGPRPRAGAAGRAGGAARRRGRVV